jgi:hypothetical protein
MVYNDGKFGSNMDDLGVWGIPFSGNPHLCISG